MAVGSFSAGLSGLNANGVYSSVIGNNLANINAAGFKSSSVIFQDLVSQTVGGYISEDALVRDAVLIPRAVVDHTPQAPASRCFRILAARIAGLGPIGGQGVRARVSPFHTTVHAAEVSQCA